MDSETEIALAKVGVELAMQLFTAIYDKKHSSEMGDKTEVADQANHIAGIANEAAALMLKLKARHTAKI